MDDTTPTPHPRSAENSAPTESTETPESDIPIHSYPLNHPKAYVGYAVALSATQTRTESTEELVTDYVINDVTGSARGARALNLVKRTDTGHKLTNHGTNIVNRALRIHGDHLSALESLDNLRGTHTRFIDLSEKWRPLATAIAYGDPAISKLVSEMERIGADTENYMLSELVLELESEAPTFTVNLFLTESDRYRSYFGSDTVSRNDRRTVLQNPDAYRSTTTYQLKTILYHLGVLTERGSDSTSLNPQRDTWKLTELV